MALSTSTFAFARATIAASGTSVAPSLTPPENCVEIIITNRIAQVVTFSFGPAGGALPDDGSNGVILASSALVLTLEIDAHRAGGQDVSEIIFDCPGGTGDVDLTYRCVSMAGSLR